MEVFRKLKQKRAALPHQGRNHALKARESVIKDVC